MFGRSKGHLRLTEATQILLTLQGGLAAFSDLVVLSAEILKQGVIDREFLSKPLVSSRCIWRQRI
jgi:hypothetical protein